MNWLKNWKKYRPKANPFKVIGGKKRLKCLKCYGHGKNRQDCQLCDRVGASSECRLCDGKGIVRVDCRFCEGRGWLPPNKQKSE